jgi:hypothetical protein
MQCPLPGMRRGTSRAAHRLFIPLPPQITTCNGVAKQARSQLHIRWTIAVIGAELDTEGITDWHRFSVDILREEIVEAQRIFDAGTPVTTSVADND